MQPSPSTITELLATTKSLAGVTIGELAKRFQFNMPENPTHAKGLLGQLLERALGAYAGSQSVPDFTQLGIELKTLPINQLGKVLETTYVCVVPMRPTPDLVWRKSAVYQKLAHVLWLPIQADAPIAERKIGSGFLWQMPLAIEAILKQDWEELMEEVVMGRVEMLTAKQGVYLQVRPKAHDSSVRTQSIGEEGQMIQALPKGFYLRTTFTQRLLNEYF